MICPGVTICAASQIVTVKASKVRRELRITKNLANQEKAGRAKRS